MSKKERISGYRFSAPDIFYTRFKKHFCPTCGTKLGFIRLSRVVNSESPEAKAYDFSGLDAFQRGNVKFLWDEFYCPECKKVITVRDLKSIESYRKYKQKKENGK